MTSCCAVPDGVAQPCPACGNSGPVVGIAPVRPHRGSVIDGPWQYCRQEGCQVVFYLAEDTIGDSSVRTQVGNKAQNMPEPVCFCFSHTVEDLTADAEAHGGTSTIKAEISQAVADGNCACEHLNPSARCCLASVHRTLKDAAKADSRITAG